MKFDLDLNLPKTEEPLKEHKKDLRAPIRYCEEWLPYYNSNKEYQERRAKNPVREIFKL